MDKPKHQLVIDGDISAELGNDISKRTFEVQDIPSLKLFNVELDGISGKVREIKLSNKSIEFVNKIQSVLDLFDKNENKYNEKIVLFSAQAVENFFVGKRKTGVIKLKCVIEACKKYFNYDEELVKKFVDLMLPHLKKSRLYRLKVYFLKLLGKLV